MKSKRPNSKGAATFLCKLTEMIAISTTKTFRHLQVCNFSNVFSFFKNHCVTVGVGLLWKTCDSSLITCLRSRSEMPQFTALCNLSWLETNPRTLKIETKGFQPVIILGWTQNIEWHQYCIVLSSVSIISSKCINNLFENATIVSVILLCQTKASLLITILALFPYWQSSYDIT